MSMSIIDLYSAVMKHLYCAVCDEWQRRYRLVFSDCLKLLLVRAETVRSRVPDRRTSDREGLTTESAEPVTWYSQMMSSG